MEGIWASVENTSEMLWSSIEAIWSKDATWINGGQQSQWDNFVYFINAVSCLLTCSLTRGSEHLMCVWSAIGLGPQVVALFP